MPADLAGIQERFHGLVTRGGEVAAIDEDFVGTPALPAAARLQIYANMYIIRLVDTLAEQFPELHAAAGDGYAELARGYLAACPPTSPSLRELGQRLPAHLAALRPELAALAELEWARLDLFDGPDVATLGLEAFQGLDPDALAGFALALAPTARLLPGDRLVFRAGALVHDRALEADEAAALAAVARGTTVGALCELLGDAAVAFGCISRWVDDELLVPAGT
jgi:hypothetical protein